MSYTRSLKSLLKTLCEAVRVYFLIHRLRRQKDYMTFPKKSTLGGRGCGLALSSLNGDRTQKSPVA